MDFSRSAGVVCASAVGCPGMRSSAETGRAGVEACGLPRIREPGLLEVHERCDGSGCQDHVWNKVICQLGCDPVDRKMVRILTTSGKSLRMFPNRVMARHEHDAAALKDHDAVVLGRKCAFRRLKIEGIVC